MKKYMYYLLDIHSGAKDGYYFYPYPQDVIDEFNKRYIGSEWICVKTPTRGATTIHEDVFHTTRLKRTDSFRIAWEKHKQ